MHRISQQQTGFSLAEVTVILAVTSLLGATISPTVGDYISDAQLTKAQADVRTLAVQFSRFAMDVPGAENLAQSWQHADLLVGPGELPRAGEGGDPAWLVAGDSAHVGLLDDHLVSNRPGYDSRATTSQFQRGWRGPYVTPGIGTDPWGHRYAINVKWFAARDGHDTIALSAGPNGIVETPFASEATRPGGDDVIALVSSGS